jgi:hypothetical protein
MLTIRMVPDKEHMAPNNVNDTLHACRIVDNLPCTSLYVHDCWNISLGMGDYSVDVFRKDGVDAGFVQLFHLPVPCSLSGIRDNENGIFSSNTP